MLEEFVIKGIGVFFMLKNLFIESIRVSVQICKNLFF